MGRLSRMFKSVVRIAAPIAFPALAPLMALSSRRSSPPIAPDEVATPAPGGGYLPALVGLAKTFKSRAGGMVTPIGVAQQLADDPLSAAIEEEVFDDDDDFDDDDFDDDDEPEDR